MLEPAAILTVVLAQVVAAAAPPSNAPERITLKVAVERALARNPRALIAEQEIARAEGLLRQARAAALPTLAGNATYTRLDAPRELRTGTDAAGQPITRIVAGQDQLSANLQLTVPLVTPRAWTDTAHAGRNRDVARASAVDVRRTLAEAVARAYLQLMAQHRQLAVLERAQQAAKAHYDHAHARLAGGIGTALDEARAEQELKTDESRVEVGYAALARAREALGLLTGGAGPVDTTEELVLPAGPGPGTAASEARERRADVRASRVRLDAAERLTSSIWTAYSPFLTAVVQPFYQNPASLVQPTTGWQAQLILSVPFYDGGAREGVRRERAAREAEERANLEAALRQSDSDVRLAFETMMRADRALASARIAAAAAQKVAALAGRAYRAGATTNLEVIDAERGARDAGSAVEAAEDEARQARLDLLLASGRFP